MYKIQFTEEALFDIEAAVLWYEEQRLGLSYDFELCLEAGIDEVLRNPEAFQKRYKNIKLDLFRASLMEFIMYAIRMK
jgi:hypothetical protein